MKTKGRYLRTTTAAFYLAFVLTGVAIVFDTIVLLGDYSTRHIRYGVGVCWTVTAGLWTLTAVLKQRVPPKNNIWRVRWLGIWTVISITNAIIWFIIAQRPL